MPIYQFEASEKLSTLAFGPTYKKALFSPLFKNVKDDTICLDQTKHLLQDAIQHAREVLVKAKDGQMKVQEHSTGKVLLTPRLLSAGWETAFLSHCTGRLGKFENQAKCMLNLLIKSLLLLIQRTFLLVAQTNASP
jgi:hypothetical protein